MKSLLELVAEKLEREPALLDIPLGNIKRWMANGHTVPHRLRQWRELILSAQESPEGFRKLLGLLRDTSEETERLRDFAPFAGVLNSQERRDAAPECVYNF
jgi:hypothetical protein